ncbi:hypothetical protein [Kribbella deserti]|uniref:Uncharacterized protein n=1 Tax=Kribbella deserti TaxID=1926257 RepID=A0ABV6QF50_9ACTN
MAKLDAGGVIIGSGESGDLLPGEKTAVVVRRSPAFAPTPTSRSKF